MDLLQSAAYLVATALFVFGLKNLSKVRTARRGNLLAAGGMLLAVVTTLAGAEVFDWTWILAGVVAGGAVGAWLARTVAMTGMPEMVALFNGLGGGASLLVALSVFWSKYLGEAHQAGQEPLSAVSSPLR